MAFSQDLLTAIINIQLGGGLAVEFAKQANDTIIDGVSGLEKCVMSLWFRVPGKTMQDANDDWDARSAVEPGTDTDGRFMGQVPVIAWGKSSDSVFSGGGGGATTYSTSSSFIGVQAVGSDSEDFYLVMRFQSQNTSTRVNTDPGSDFRSEEGNFYAIGISQGSIHQYSSNEIEPIKVTVEQWHHLLMSWEVSGPNGRLWLSLDDQNYNGAAFYPASPFCMGLFGHSGDPNDIMATYDWPIYHDGHSLPSNIKITSGGFAMPTSPVGLPIQAEYADQYSLGAVELSELQIFCGSTLDTSVETNRRAFIDYKRDNEGHPISGSLEPADPKAAEKLLHKRPDVLLHGASNWQQGKNTGSLGMTDGGEDLASGWFDPTGTITKYKPDPSLKPSG